MLCLLLCTGMFGMFASANGEGSHFHDGIEFQPWTDNSTLPASGNWYLTSDVDILRRVEVSGNLSLCLNGHGISSSGNECLFYLGAGNTLDLYDCGFYAEHKFILNHVAENGSVLAAVDDNLRTGYKTFTAEYVNGEWVGQTTFVESQVTEEARGSVWTWLLNAFIKLIILIFQGVGA